MKRYGNGSKSKSPPCLVESNRTSDVFIAMGVFGYISKMSSTGLRITLNTYHVKIQKIVEAAITSEANIGCRSSQ